MILQLYNCLFKLIGIKGYVIKYFIFEYVLLGDVMKDIVFNMDDINVYSFLNDVQKEVFEKKYYYFIFIKFGEKGCVMGYGGMDYIMDVCLVYCL